MRRGAAAWEAAFSEHLGLLRRLTEQVGRHHHLDADAVADFTSWALVRIMDNGYAILRAYDGRGRMATYLRTVVGNLFRDFRNHLWGKWRPSACARRLGTLAVELERLIHRDGFGVEEAIRIVADRRGRSTTREELEAVAERLPRRPVVRQEVLEEDQLRTESSPLSLLEDRDRRRVRTQADRALESALAGLPATDRKILQLHFFQGRTLADVARKLKLDQRSLYSRRDRCLGRLRRTLESKGLGWREVGPLIGQDTMTNVI